MARKASKESLQNDYEYKVTQQVKNKSLKLLKRDPEELNNQIKIKGNSLNFPNFFKEEVNRKLIKNQKKEILKTLGDIK